MSIDFKIRDFLYPREIWTLHRTLGRTQWLPPDQLCEYQNARLREIIRHAYEYVPYYHRLFHALGLGPGDIRHLEDLRKLPVLTKRAVRNHGNSLLAENAHRYRPQPYSTSGTSGEPLTICLDKGANALEFAYYWRHWSWGGYRLGNRFAELGSHFFMKRAELSERPFYFQRHLGRLMLNSAQVSQQGARQMAAAVRKYRPRFLKGVSSTLYFFGLSLKEAGVSDLAFRCVFSTGEVVTRMYRTMVEEVFKAPLLDSYGHMERTVSISQCLQGGYHINSDYGILEIEDTRPLENGQTAIGGALGTSLYNLAMPLVRYDLEDEIELFLDGRSCPCGRSLPLVKAIHGRTQDVIVTPDGRYITSLFIVPEFVPGIRFVQFHQNSREELEIKVVKGVGWDTAQEGQLLEYTRRLVGPLMKIRVILVSTSQLLKDRSGKIRSVIGLDSV